MKITTHEGRIDLDTEEAKNLGFTSDRFVMSYLYKKGSDIWISLIISSADGNLSKLFKRIHELGYTIKVPSPLDKMRKIVEAKGFVHSVEYDKNIGENVDVWTKAP